VTHLPRSVTGKQTNTATIRVLFHLPRAASASTAQRGRRRPHMALLGLSGLRSKSSELRGKADVHGLVFGPADPNLGAGVNYALLEVEVLNLK
jgi:hypothetical protein